METANKCLTCDGSGKVGSLPTSPHYEVCAVCKGTGELYTNEELEDLRLYLECNSYREVLSRFIEEHINSLLAHDHSIASRNK